MIGRTISHYKITRKVGEGGMGVVYEAEDLTLKRSVALKFLPIHALDDEEQKTRLVREAQAAAALDHININTVYEIGEVDGQTFMAMAFVPGESLRAKIKRGNIPVEEAVGYAIQIAAGLSRAHAQGIVHRDIKPANVLTTEEGIVKLVDFGLAKLAGATGLTKTDSTLGTAAYMSPEQAKGQVVDHRTDIWSLGVILYELVTGKLPFRGEHEAVVVYSILNEEYTPPREFVSDLPDELEAILKKALTKKPDERYQSVDQMLADLRAMHHTAPVDITAPISVTRSQIAPAKPQGLPRRFVYMAGAAVLLIVIFFVTMFALRSPDEAPMIAVGDSVSTADSLAAAGMTAVRLDSLTAAADDAAAATGGTTPSATTEERSSAAAVDTAAPWVPLVLALPDSSADSLAEDQTGPPTVAVLYLENLSGSRDDDYFAAGLTEDIIGDLSNIRALRVLSRYDVIPYRGKAIDVRKVGEELGVDYLVEGSVRRDKETLRINARLVKVGDGTLEWNKRFDRPVKDVFAVQAEIAEAVAEAMKVEIVESQRATMARVPTTDLEAYDNYLKGRFYRDQRSEKDNGEAERYFRRALDRDANFALAKIGLADVYLQRVDWGLDADPKWIAEARSLLNQVRTAKVEDIELYRALEILYRNTCEGDKAVEASQKAVELHPYDYRSYYGLAWARTAAFDYPAARGAAEKCLELKPDFPEAHRLLFLLAWREGKVRTAERHLWDAMKLAPEAAHLLVQSARFLISQGKLPQARPDIEKAIRLKPDTHRYYGVLGLLDVVEGNLSTGIGHLRDATRDSEDDDSYWYLGWAFTADGDERNARRTWEKCRKFSERNLQICPNDLESSYRILWMDCMTGDEADPIARLAELDAASFKESSVAERAYYKAGILAAIGDQAGANDQLQKVIKGRYYSAAYIAAAPEFRALHNNSDFRKMVGLNETG